MNGFLLLLVIFLVIIVFLILASLALSAPKREYGVKSVTAKGEQVRSIAERRIADYFARDNIRSSSFEKWYFESWHKYPLKKSAIQRNHYKVLEWATQNVAFSLHGEGKVALDVGCGHGYTMALLNTLGFETYGCDISTLFLKSYAKNVTENLILCDAQSMAFRNDYFDVIVAFDMIEHLSRITEFLESCHMTLKRKGVLVMTTPLGVEFLDLNGLKARFLTKLLLGTTNVEGHVNEFRSVKELRQVLKSVGFSFIKIELWWYVPIPLQLFKRYVAVRAPTFVIPHFRCIAVKSH